jgi:hypothetical protein
MIGYDDQRQEMSGACPCHASYGIKPVLLVTSISQNVVQNYLTQVKMRDVYQQHHWILMFADVKIPTQAFRQPLKYEKPRRPFLIINEADIVNGARVVVCF